MSPFAGAAAYIAAHKAVVVGGGAATAVGLGLYKRHAKTTQAAQAPAQPGGSTIAGYGMPATGAAGSYDSSANDVYNAIQPQLEQTQGILRTVLDKLNSAPAPAPAAAAPAAAPPPPPTVYQPPPPAAPPPPPRVAPAPAPAAPQARSYVVQRGDNLTFIARRFGVRNWQTLYNANRAAVGRNPNLIHPGLRLMIP